MKNKKKRIPLIFYAAISILILILTGVVVKNIVTDLTGEKKDELNEDETQGEYSEYSPLTAEYIYLDKDNFDFSNYKTYQTEDRFVKLLFPESFTIEFLIGDECNKYIGKDSRCVILKGRDIGYLRIQYVKGIEEKYGEPGKFSGYMDQVGYIIESENIGKLFRNNISNYTYDGDESSLNLYFIGEIFEKTEVNEEFGISSFGTGTNWLVKENIGVSISYRLNIPANEVPGNKKLLLFDQILSTLEIDFSVDPFAN